MKKGNYLRATLMECLFAICAFILLISMKETAPIWLYIMPMIPAVVLIVIWLFNLRQNSKWSLMFWILFAVSFIVFWFNPKSITYFAMDSFSITAFVYFVLTVIFAIVAPRSSINDTFGYRTMVAKSDPRIWKEVHKTLSEVGSSFALPLFLLIFYVPGIFKFWLATILFLIGQIGGGMIGEIKARPLIREIRKKEKEDLEKEIRKEQGYR